MQNFRLNICGFEMMKKIYRTLDTNFASYYIILDCQSVGNSHQKRATATIFLFLLNGHLKKRNIPLPTYLFGGCLFTSTSLFLASKDCKAN